MINLPLDHCPQFGHHIMPCYQEMRESRFRLATFQKSEQSIDIPHQRLVGSEQRHIGIDLGGLLIKIARAQVNQVTTTSTIGFLLPQDQSHFGMHLQTGNAVDDPDTGLPHPLCGREIVFLIETGLQLNKDSHPLAVLSRTD